MAALKNIIKKLWLYKFKQENDRAKCFDEDLGYYGSFKLTKSSIGRVQLNQVVGSVGKCTSFDSNFSLKGHLPQDRLLGIIQAMQNNKMLPPVNLYKFKNAYYVMDGNHRVAAAKELGRFEIKAKIVELIPLGKICCISEQSVADTENDPRG
jgi:uncharacterized ParB-like nuclease family protein